MAMFKLPLSGDVVQSISPQIWWMGNQFGLVNISVGQSSAPEIESDVLTKVAGYGQQLGIISDAVAVLIAKTLATAPLNPEEKAAIDALEALINGVAEVKKKHKRPAMRLVAGRLCGS
jgi:hypothetical protein